MGEFKNDKKHGQGTYTLACGHVYYGQMEGGKRHGYGTYTLASGNKYLGEFKNDKKHGQGTYTLASGTIDHSGEWENGKPIVSFFIFLSYIKLLLLLSSFSYNFQYV